MEASRKVHHVLCSFFLGKHVDEPLFLVGIEAAGVHPLLWILVGAEQHVSPGDIAEVVLVGGVLVMDAVHLRTLEHEADPAGRAHVGVMEELAERGEGGVDRAGFRVAEGQEPGCNGLAW